MMADTYTFVLDVGGGTYMSQNVGNTVINALKVWAESPDAAVIKAFEADDGMKLKRAVDSIVASPEGVVPIAGLKSAWFVSLKIDNAAGFLNIIRTM